MQSHLSCRPPANICPTYILHTAVYARKHHFIVQKLFPNTKADHSLAVQYMKHICLSKKTVFIRTWDIFSVKMLMGKFKSKLCHVQFSGRMGVRVTSKQTNKQTNNKSTLYIRDLLGLTSLRLWVSRRALAYSACTAFDNFSYHYSIRYLFKLIKVVFIS